MARFRYRSVPPAGAAAAGEIEALDQRAAVAHLQAAGHYPLDVSPATGPAPPDVTAAGPKRAIAVRAGEAALVVRQMGTLVSAGVPLERALALTADLAQRPALAALVLRLRAEIQAGASLSAALGAAGDAFGPLATAMVRAGETSGRLGQALDLAALWLERNRDLGEAVRSALVYPVVLVAVASGAVLLLLGFVIPRFEAMFRDMAGRLPWETRAVLAVAHGLADYGPFAAAGLIGAAMALRWHGGRPGGRRFWHGLVLDLPLLGELLLKREIERFTRALAGLVGAGVALPEAAELARATLVNQALRDATAGLAGDIRQGLAPTEALARCGRFPPAVIGLAAVGEETGRLAAMLDQAAELYRREVEARTARLMTLLTPVLTIGLGLVIAAIILSLLLPILGLYETIL
jgi:general secretion pathway protein F